VTVDTGTPLITWADLTRGAFADLVRGYTDPSAQANLLIEGCREVEGMCDRRFMPFTLTGESHRADGIDPDEVNGDATIPMDIRSTISQSYATSLGATSNLAREVWLNEYAPRYPEFWTYSNVSVSVVRSYGGAQSGIQLLDGPAVDSGRVWFLLGSFIPVGSQIYVTYSGGYTTTPADLARICKLACAALVAEELDPYGESYGHHPEDLRARAEMRCAPYMRG
jgi:hypothetical protein